MTGLAQALEQLTAQADAASAAEQQFDRDIARRRAEVTEARAFAWRRLNHLRELAREIGKHEELEAALEAGRQHLRREFGWSPANEKHEEVLSRYEPVLIAIHAAGRGEDGQPVLDEMSAFEAWYAQTRGAPFLRLMQREVVELPLVEVS